MYRNSAYSRMKSPALTPRWFTRFKNFLLLILLIGVIALAIFGGRGMAFRGEAKELFVSRIQLECGNALNLTNGLSRTAGATSSSAILQKEAISFAVWASLSKRIKNSSTLSWAAVAMPIY